MRIASFFKPVVLAALALALSSGAFAAKESFRAQSLTADQAYGGVINLTPVSGSAQVFASSNGGGISRSNDGVSWTPKNNGLTSLWVRNVAVNQLLTSHVYAGTTDGAGFYKSTDSGDTWVPLAAGTGLNCRNVQNISVFLNATVPTSPHIFASTGCPGATSGLYKSEDGGGTWQQVPLGLPLGAVAQSVNIHFQNSTTMAYSARASTSVGQYQTTNGGAGFAGAWASINGTGMSGPVGLNGLYSFNTSTATNGAFVMAMVIGKGIYRSAATSGSVSTSGSAVWTQVLGSTGSPKAPISGIFQRFFGATQDQNRYVTIDGEGTYVSTNNGATWALEPLLSFSKQIRNVARDSVVATTFWAATYHGLFKSTDSMATWAKVTAAGLPGAYLSRVIAPDPNNPQFLLSSGSLLQQSSDGGVTWSINADIPHLSFPAGDLRIANTSGSLVFATTTNGGIYRSTNGGVNWSQLPFLLTGTVGPIGRIRIFTRPGSPAVYAAVGQNGIGSAAGGAGGSYDDRFDNQKIGLYRTLDSGTTWTALLGSVVSGSVGPVNAVASAPGNPSTLMAATGDGLYKSTNSGATWRLVGPTLVYPSTNSASGGAIVSAGAIVDAGAASFGVGFVDYDPLNANNVVATTYDVDALNRATAFSGLYRSRDGGETWEQVASHDKIVGARFVVANGKSVPYVVSRGWFDEEFSEVFRCPELFTLPSGDVRHMRCSALALEATVDGKASIANTLSIPLSGQILGIATQTSGFQKFARTNIGPDFNNDGTTDVFWRNTTTGGQNFLWRMQRGGDGQTSSVHPSESAFLPTVATNWAVAGYGDFNGDGNTDILWRNSTNGDNYIYLMDGSTVLAGSGFILNVPTSWTVAGTGDFNGDGKDDILWRNSGTGDNYLYVMDGLTVMGSSGYLPTVPSTWTAAGTGDLDGDGKADILWRNIGLGGVNYAYLMNGTSVTAQGYLPTVPGSWIVGGMRDLDGDRKADIVWRNQTGTGENYVYFMNGLSVLGTSGYLPTVADMNWQIRGVGNYAEESATRGILWSNVTTRSNYLWRLSGVGLQLTMPCANMGSCDNANYLPTAPVDWAIIHK